MDIKELVKNIFEISSYYKENGGYIYIVIFDRVIMATLEWAKKNKIRDVDINDSDTLSQLQSAVRASHKSKPDRVMKILHLALNKAPLEDYIKEFPFEKKKPSKRFKKSKYGHPPAENGGEWSGWWDNAVGRYEGD